MIIVRRGELACRNGWSQDLWTPKTEADGDTDVVLHQPVVAAQPLPPASAEEIRSVINAQRSPQSSDPPSQPVDVVVGPDGSLYIAEDNNQRVRRVWPNGIITTWAGGGTQQVFDIPATQAQFNGGGPTHLALAPDGSLYISDSTKGRIWRVVAGGRAKTE